MLPVECFRWSGSKEWVVALRAALCFIGHDQSAGLRISRYLHCLDAKHHSYFGAYNSDTGFGPFTMAHHALSDLKDSTSSCSQHALSALPQFWPSGVTGLRSVNWTSTLWQSATWSWKKKTWKLLELKLARDISIIPLHLVSLALAWSKPKLGNCVVHWLMPLSNAFTDQYPMQSAKTHKQQKCSFWSCC